MPRVASIMLWLLACAGPVACLSARAVENPADRTTRHIRYGFTLENTRGQILERADLWVYAPVKETAWQEGGALDSNHPYTLIEDELGNRIMHYAFHSLPPFARKTVTVRADVHFRSEPEGLDAAPMGFLDVGPLMNYRHEAFQRMAPDFGESTGGQRPRDILHWVQSHVQNRGYLPRDRGAVYALEQGEGDCTEYMALFAALCRRESIPARGVGGYICENDQVIRPVDYHNWAEYLEDGIWRIADPQNGVLADGGTRYLAIHILGSQTNAMKGFPRFRYEGDGLRVRMN